MLTDVIAALTTPPGRSAIALLRLSGTGAHALAARVLRDFAAMPLRTARLTHAVHPDRGEVLDQVLYIAYGAPASFTGEDMVEVTTHGGLLVPAEVLGALLAAGARQAAPGEFARRALQHGKMDLLQLEGMADLIDATAPAQRRAAIAQVDRGLSERIAALRTQVLELEALVSYDIDFPEEDSGPVPPDRITGAIRDLDTSLAGLLSTAAEGERLREGALVVIAGRPNAGKSSLFNGLLGLERAIVTEIPGTTRDAVEAHGSCNGFPFRFVDTAGLRDTDETVERLGIEVSRRYLRAADIVLFCTEAGRDPDSDERRFIADLAVPVILVRTKADQARSVMTEGVPVSVRTGDGLEQLRARLAELAFTGIAATGDVTPVITRERHRAALTRTREEIACFGEARDAGLEGAVAATHLRAAVTALEDVIGVVTPDDVLDRVFGMFCVGK
jgi:tRNA modification GTPase